MCHLCNQTFYEPSDLYDDWPDLPFIDVAPARVQVADYRLREIVARALRQAEAVYVTGRITDADALCLYDAIVPGKMFMAGITRWNGYQCPAAAIGRDDLVGTFGGIFDGLVEQEILSNSDVILEVV